MIQSQPLTKLFLIIMAAGWLLCSCGNPNRTVTLDTDDDATTISAGEQPLLRYVHSETPAPEGQDPLYKRSAYIHPLWSPGGAVLTRIQPPDHYHHYGIWNPWTRTTFGDRKVDFWNLKAGEGTVRFAEYLEKTGSGKHAGFTARHEHIFFKEDGAEGVAIEETWDVKIHDVLEDRYTADMVVTLQTPLETGISLDAYRYGGGIGFRATEEWHTDNSTVRTSEGYTRADADSTRARWTIIEGESTVPQGRSGILFLSHPENRDHPEPMRVWPPDNQGGRSNVYFQFCPIRHIPWVLEPGKTYSLRYRMVVFDGTLTEEVAEDYWRGFSDS